MDRIIAWCERRPSPTADRRIGAVRGGSATTTFFPAYVIHWNAPEWCAATVASISASRGVTADITVIDNSDIEPWPDNVPGVRVIRNAENRGYTGAANQALQDWLARSDAPWCLITSHDLVIGTDGLRTLVDVLISDPAIGIVGPTLIGKHAESAITAAAPLETVAWISGSCLLIRRECAVDVGLFDESYGSYVEDADYCYRARDAGWGVARAADAVATMKGSVSPTAELQTLTNSVALARKRRGRIGAGVRIATLCTVAGRNLFGALLPFRSAEARSNSRRSAARHLRAARSGLRLMTSSPSEPADLVAGRVGRAAC